MPEFTEGKLRFEFDDRWTVQKYDGHRDYREKIERLKDTEAATKAVDFVGLLDGALFWIEVKDFRGHRIENKPRLDNGGLVVEVALKVRDSIAGIVGAYHTSSDPATWQPFVRAMVKRRCDINVLLWIEEDPPSGPRGRQSNRAQVLANQLKIRVKWLTKRVFVMGQRLGGQPDGCTVSNLPGAGQGG